MSDERDLTDSERLILAAAELPDAGPSRDEKRRAILLDEVQRCQAYGHDLVADHGLSVIMKRGHRPNHVLHLILSVLTLGVWAVLVWLPIGLFGGEQRYVLRVDEHGQVARSKS